MACKNTGLLGPEILEGHSVGSGNTGELGETDWVTTYTGSSSGDASPRTFSIPEIALSAMTSRATPPLKRVLSPGTAGVAHLIQQKFVW